MRQKSDGPYASFAAAAETHSAVVYFAGDRAYKLKKPVNLGFLDFSTEELRAAACVRETELNRRFAPDVYLGVAKVIAPDNEPCDHLVVMRRMPAQRALSALVREGEPADEPVREVARTLAAQHASASRSGQIDQAGGRDALRGRWKDNVEQAGQVGEAVIGEPAVSEVGSLADQFLAGRRPLFDGRVAAGRIVDGHGDLLADDIYCLGDGPRILDCLDFDDRLRWLDGVDDAAFLAMDLERLGAPSLARRFIEWYGEFSGDPAPASLRHHYVAYRAFVRAKVACIKHAQGDGSAGDDARRLTELTLRHLRAGAVTMVLIGGLPGTGKSTLAGAVADRLGWTVLASDRVRKELAGVSPRQSAASAYATGIYTSEWTERCYAELLHRARRLLAHGESVILDASWITESQRAAAARVADDVSAQLVQLRCDAPQDLARKRLMTRHGSLSDADGAIARQMAAVMDPWPSATTVGSAQDAAGAGEVAGLARALEVIRPQGSEHVWRVGRPVMLPG
jgi:uncharacterized protein